MRVALVSPYSHAYPGGVSRHAEALAEELLSHDHDVRLFAPDDPDDALARLLHRGARPQRRSRPDYLVPLGRTVAISANGSTSNLACTLEGVARLGRELRTGRFDVVHVQEPNAPLASWVAVELSPAPVVGTFHTHSTSRLANLAAANLAGARRLYNKLAVRMAVSEAARWTAARFYGGGYRIVPNGVDLPPAAPLGRDATAPFRLLYLGRADERKGLPVVLRAVEELRATGPDVRLTVAGAEPASVRGPSRNLVGIDLVGVVSEDDKRRLLAQADLLCAPSLGRESFGIVVVEALAAGTPVVCSDIPGYREVVRQGVEGLLFPPGAADELAAAVRTLAGDERLRLGMAVAGRARAERYAWPRIADQVIQGYEDALASPAAQGSVDRAARRLGLRSADRGTRTAAPPLRSPGGKGPHRRARRSRGERRPALAGAVLAAAGLGALALGDNSLALGAAAAPSGAPLWVAAALVLMSLSLLARAGAWHAILRGALEPSPPPSRPAAARATAIGVLMSATLPARLGEAARAIVVSRRVGGVRARLPLVAGTIVSQAALNGVALALLAVGVLAGTTAFAGSEREVGLASLVPAALLLALVTAATLLRRSRAGADGKPLRRLDELTRALNALRSPHCGLPAFCLQLVAWALQLSAVYAVLFATGLASGVGLAGAAAVLLAVNVAGALPALPANVGVFQAACVAALVALGVGYPEALAFGVVLQGLELGVAAGLGAPALVYEGTTWRALRGRALEAVSLDAGVLPPAPAR